MIARDLERASGQRYDLAIVGGGVYGVTLALEAARRGLRPVLVERGDFGAETSWNSLRILHGGIRYLQTLDLIRFRESVTERSWWLRNFPELVEPLPCLMPLYGQGLHRPAVLRAAAMLDHFLSRRRNEGVRPDRRLAPARVLSPAATAEWFPGVDRDGLRGAVLWHDAAMPSSQRLIIELLHWINLCGGVTLNYVAADRPLIDEGAIAGLSVVDRLTGSELEIRAASVINCAGPWCREVAAALDRDVPELFSYSVALNLLLDRAPPSEAALALRARRRGARTFFLVPWFGRLFAGTYHAAVSSAQPPQSLDPALVTRMLEELDAAAPQLGLEPETVLAVHWGLLPAQRASREELAVRPRLVDHGRHGGPQGLVSVSGVKFTTARDVAEKTLRFLYRRRNTPLPEPAGPDRPELTGWPSLDELQRQAAVRPDSTAARLTRLVEAESVHHLEDMVFRRTDWASDPRQVEAIAILVARLLPWDEERASREILQCRAAAS